MLHSFFWSILRRLNFIFRRFGILYSIFRDGAGRKNNGDEIAMVYLPLVFLPAYTTYEDGIEYSETSAHKIRTLGESPKRKTATRINFSHKFVSGLVRNNYIRCRRV